MDRTYIGGGKFIDTPPDGFVFTCVNEEGVRYDEFRNPDEALAMLTEFPNDFVIITVDGADNIIKQLNVGGAIEAYAEQCDIGNTMYLDRKSTTRRLRAIAAGDV